MTAPKTPKTIDPDILKLRNEHKNNVSLLRERRNSKKILETILEKRLPRMVMADREKLCDHLQKTTTPPLLLTEAPACCLAPSPAPVPVPPPTTPPAPTQANRPVATAPKLVIPRVAQPQIPVEPRR